MVTPAGNSGAAYAHLDAIAISTKTSVKRQATSSGRETQPAAWAGLHDGDAFVRFL